MAIVNTVNYDDAVNQVLEYFEAHGIDAEDVVLDGNVDLASFDDPVFEAYFQMAYQQLMEILYPEVINSLESAVGEVNYDTLYANAGDDINQQILLLLEDDEDLFIEVTRLASGDTEADYLTALLAATAGDSDTGDGSDSEASYEYDTKLTDDAWGLIEDGSLDESYSWIIETEDSFMAVEQSILDRLNEYDEAMIQLAEDLASGNMSEDQYNQELGSVTAGREGLFAMLGALQDQSANFFQMISKLIENQIDTSLGIIRNISG